jgi:predicted membrane-bound spermidine synthase
MTLTDRIQTNVRMSRENSVPALTAVFFFSGLASLIYQVAWQRLLTVYYGVGAVSITIIVSVYMLGLGLGSLLGGRLAERSPDLYRLYAVVEGALGIVGIISFPLILTVGRLTAGASAAFSFVFLFALLCVPTLLMGITLPLLTTIFTRVTGSFIFSVSRLLFINTIGAASGAVLTSYILISLLGLDGSIYLAAGIDIVLAAVILMARRAERQATGATGIGTPSAGEAPGWGWRAYLLVFVAGFLAIGYEIIWYRVIGVLVKDSPYAFASVLSVYLLGVALGSLGIQKVVDGKPDASRRDLFFAAQFLIGLTVLLTFIGYYYLSRHAPVQWLARLSFSTELHPSLALFRHRAGLHWFSGAYLFLDVFLWPLAFLLMPTALMGASFPLISSLALSRRGGEGRAVGTTYFFAVIGNVLGGLLTGFVLLPVAGTERTVLSFGALGLLFGLLPRAIGNWYAPRIYRIAAVLLLLIGALAVFPRRGNLYAAMHEFPFTRGTTRFEEGFDAVVFTCQEGEQLRNFINGQGHGYRPGPLFYAEAIEGLTLAASPRNVLVIGFGTGSIAEAALLTAEVQRVTVVELCGSAITNLRKFPVVDAILGDRRIQVVVDDGRRFLQRSGEQFDAILMDPVRTTTAYSNNLHSRQFFALAAQHLAPGGILMVGGIEENKLVSRTLLAEFPYVRSYDSYSLASRAPLRRYRERLERVLGSFPVEMQAAIWDRMQDPLEGALLERATAGYPVNEDWRPVSEYYLGWQLRQWLAHASLR